MGEMTIKEFDEHQLACLNEAAMRSGREPSALARDMIVYLLAAGPKATAPSLNPAETVDDDDSGRRLTLIQELRDVRAMTLKPLRSDSTLIIRELRDADG